MIRNFALFVFIINLSVYLLGTKIFTVFNEEKATKERQKQAKINKLKVEQLKLHSQSSYNFQHPKKGYVKNLIDKKIVDIPFNTIHHVNAHLTSKGYAYIYTAPSLEQKRYAVNAYLNGYVPYNIESVWQALKELRTRFKYRLDVLNQDKNMESWQTSKQSFNKLHGDCEDHAIALCDWLIGLGYDARVVIGEVQFKGQKRGGHAWVVLFEENRVYLLEATQKEKWNLLPIASTLPFYYPVTMFNRTDFWVNTKTSNTMDYKSEVWIKSGKFIPRNDFYPDLQKESENFSKKKGLIAEY